MLKIALVSLITVVKKENGLFILEMGLLLYRKGYDQSEKGMAHSKRALRYKKRAWRSAILKGPRGNTINSPMRAGEWNFTPAALLKFSISLESHSYKQMYLINLA